MNFLHIIRRHITVWPDILLLFGIWITSSGSYRLTRYFIIVWNLNYEFWILLFDQKFPSCLELKYRPETTLVPDHIVWPVLFLLGIWILSKTYHIEQKPNLPGKFIRAIRLKTNYSDIIFFRLLLNPDTISTAFCKFYQKSHLIVYNLIKSNAHGEIQ